MEEAERGGAAPLLPVAAGGLATPVSLRRVTGGWAEAVGQL